MKHAIAHVGISTLGRPITMRHCASLDVITIKLDETLLKPKYGNDIETSAYKS